jgi:L-ascorbate metabolism protein UlaG (beta-lactamase superfamily)
MRTAVSFALIGFLSLVLSGFAAAQLTGAPAERTKLITLGTQGGPLPSKARTQSSNLLVVNGALYLIDAGDNVTRRMVQSGHDFRKVSKIFITHPHSDHTAGLATLMVSQWEYQRAEPTDIYGGGVEALVKGALAYLTPNAEIRWAEGKKRPMADTFHGHDVNAGVIYQDANVKVTAVENTHFNFQPGTPPYGKYKSFSYRVDAPDRSFLFTGDTGWSDAVIDLARGADVLVTEVTSVPEATSLDLLQQVYRNCSLPLSTRMRAAQAAIPFEHPKLAVTANLPGEGIAELLERAIARSGLGPKLIDQPKVVEHAPELQTPEPQAGPVPDRRFRR